MTEVWKPVRDWPAYEVSNLGHVRSIDRMAPNGGGRVYPVSGRLLTPRRNQNSYLVVTLRAGKTKRATPMVHRLVAEAFIPNPLGKPHVNHLDCDPSNPRASNLEWCTQQENLAYMRALGRQSRHMLGKRSPVAILSDDQVKALRLRRQSAGISFEQLGKEFGISKRAAMRCVKRETYQDVR